MTHATHTTTTRDSWAVVSAGRQRWWILQGPFAPAAQPAVSGCSLWHAPFALPEFLAAGGLPWAVPASARCVDARALHDWLTQRFGTRIEAAAIDLGNGAWLPPDFELFRDSFDALMPHLASGALRKGVPLTRTRWVPAAHVTLRQVQARIAAMVARLPAIEACTGAAGYALFDDEGAGFVGATPELLFEIAEPSLLRTAALAVTRVRERDAAINESAAFRCAREEREHDLVLDHLRARLPRFGSVEIGTRRPRSYGRIIHLETPVTVRLATGPVPATRLISALHPTPALATAPVPDESEVARCWLRDFASLRGERGEFGAPFGVWHPDSGGHGRILVAIRQVRLAPNGILDVPAGCGVVAGSRLEDEWVEARAKIAAVDALFFPHAYEGDECRNVIGGGELSHG